MEFHDGNWVGHTILFAVMSHVAEDMNREVTLECYQVATLNAMEKDRLCVTKTLPYHSSDDPNNSKLIYYH